MAGRAAEPRKRRTINSTAKITRPISKRLDIISRNAPPKPMLESKAAIPRPAAMPAIGPRKRDIPDLAAVPAAAVPAAAAPAAGAAERVVLLAAAGGVAAERLLVILEDWRPKLEPPPIRRASAS